MKKQKIKIGGEPQLRLAFKAFTLAEVLITLVIIGVIAAITVPTLMAHQRKIEYVTQLKKTYSTLANGFKLAMVNDGVTKFEDTVLFSKIDTDTIETEQSPEFFLELYKAFQVSKSFNSFEDRGEYRIDYGTFDTPITQDCVVAVLNDGTILYIRLSGSPYSGAENNKGNLKQSIGEVYVDVNGLKGPNLAGRDLFAFAVSNNGEIFPLGGADYAYHNGSESLIWNKDGSAWKCPNANENIGCTARVIEEGWQMNY